MTGHGTTGHGHHGRGDAAILTASVLWGLGTVLMKDVLGDSPGTLKIFVFNGLRLPLSVLLLFSAEKLSGRSVLMRTEHIGTFAAISFLGFINVLFFLFGLKLTSASNVGVITATVPLFILLAASMTGIEHPTGYTVIGVLIGFLGTMLVTFQGGVHSVNIGDFLILGACALMALFTVYSRKLLELYSPMVTAGWIFLFIFAYQSPFFLCELPSQSWSAISSGTWLNFAAIVIGPMFLANSLYYYSIRTIGPSRVGVYSYLTPIFTLLFAFLMRGETITFLHVVGLTIIITGITVTKKGPARRPPFRV